ncbi:regulatory protein TetR [Coriobacterium glomerans PW2]|uniref:Regulatory protein TetR n=1 Tax=Coriobacterium glomerans (strain ATCC 49209 / DSM 20642 / JCM 10262 / PW2) TaxID=700015 RepID=F2NBA5_CORGP|nr:TetR family transcriptional regulator [Coriobacterium glomerans]AEB06641.1 regulatory protein TetR [Coriobacterium glomerans PW2]
MVQREDRSSRHRDRRFARTERAIHEAFFSLIEQRDYRKVTITALARLADIDRKTFYLHYDSIEDVADAIFREEADRLVDLLRADLAKDTSSIDVGLLLFNLSANLAPNLSRTKRIAEHMPVEVILRRIERPLTQALIEDDHLGLGSMGPYLSYCVSFFIAGLLAMYRRWLLSDSEIALEDISAVASTAVFSGINGILAEDASTRTNVDMIGDRH